MTDIGNLEEILVGTEYEDSIPCIQATFDTAGIKTLNDLDNAPRILTFCVCNHDTYPLLSVVREKTLNPPPKPKATAKKSRSKKKSPKPKPEVVEELPPPEDESPEGVVDEQVKDDQEVKE